MKRIGHALMLLAALITTVGAQPRVFIAPMEEGFDSFLAAALIDNKVPVSITVEECSADYVISG